MFEGIRDFFRGSNLEEKKQEDAEKMLRKIENENDPSREAKATFVEHTDAEKGKVIEYNAEYYNNRMENLVTEVQKNEAEKEEKRTGGWFGGISRALEKNDTLRQIKIWGKVIGGSIAAVIGTLGSAGLASPAAFSLGGKYALDGAIEAFQYYGCEKGVGKQIQEAKNKRVELIYKMVELGKDMPRGIMIDRGTDTETTPGENINELLVSLVEKIEEQERKIFDGEQQLAKIRDNFRKIRLGAGLAFGLGTMAYAGLYGMNMGVADYDNGTKAGEIFKSLVTNPTDSHQLRLYLNGVHFMYNAPTELTHQAVQQGFHLTQLTDAAGLKSHMLGGINVPWGKIAGSIAATIGGLTLSSVHDYQQMRQASEYRNYTEKDMKTAYFNMMEKPKEGFGKLNEFASIRKEDDEQVGFAKKLVPDLVFTSQGELKNPIAGEKERTYKIINITGDNVLLAEFDNKNKEVKGSRISLTSQELYAYDKNKLAWIKEAAKTPAGVATPETKTTTNDWQEFLDENGINEEVKQVKIINADTLGLKKDNIYDIRFDADKNKVIFAKNERGKDGKYTVVWKSPILIDLDAFKTEYGKDNKNFGMVTERHEKTKDDKEDEEKPDFENALKEMGGGSSGGIFTLPDVKKAIWQGVAEGIDGFWRVKSYNLVSKKFHLELCNKDNGKLIVGPGAERADVDAKDFVETAKVY